MLKEQIKKIITNNNLTCTTTQFTTYMNWLTIDTSMYDSLLPTKCLFSKKYNWHKIDNPANWKYYYHITIWWMTFLQNTVPFSEWHQPLDDTNIDTVIAKHKKFLIQWYIDNEKLRLTIEHFKPAIKSTNPLIV